jgi:hypothetical protein
MTLKDYNPFTQLELRLPDAYRDQVTKYSRTFGDAGSSSKTEDSPFERYVDVWMASICVAVAQGREVEVPTAAKTWRFEYGSRLQGQTAWIDVLQLLAVAHFRDPLVVADARRVIDLANAFAAVGLPVVLQMLADGHDRPLWNLSMRMMELVLTVLPDPDESDETVTAI